MARTAFMRSRLRTTLTGAASGVAPPHRPVLPPRGTTGTPASLQSARQVATSAVVRGRTTACAWPVSYTHLDVYKRQIHQSAYGASFNRRVKTFSDRLKHARLLRGHTQKTLARLTRLSQSAIGSYESGLRHSSRSLRKLAQVLKVELEWLETGKGPMELPMESYDLSDTCLLYTSRCV